MKGRINSFGVLEIFRKKAFKITECCKQHISLTGNKGSIKCGDWCPQFGEPVIWDAEEGETTASLIICENKTLNFNKFKDLRGGKE